MSLVSRITLDGVADTTLGFEVLAGYDEPLLPDVRTRSVEIPGRAGRWEFAGDLASREIRLPCSVFSGSMAALATAARAIAAALLDGDGKPKDVSLVFLKEATKTYTVRYSGAVPVERLVGSGLGNFTLSLVASDPYAYGAETTVTESVTVSPTEIEITNDGTVSTPVVITITNNGAGNVTGIKVAQKKVG
jgi:phage-related protein